MSIQRVLEGQPPSSRPATVGLKHSIRRARVLIVQMALDEDYDLIVIGKRGMGVLEELVMGNVARKVVDISKVPVTIIP